MCGICGIINFKESEVDQSHITDMMQALKHRGPDDEGLFIEKNIGFGFVRLSIIDLSTSGHQPMTSPDGNYVLIFNGEVYNYLEIREELESQDVVFHSKSDTEVLLQSYIRWGPKCLDKFNGMFAFAIYDRSKKAVFAARDRFGVKPFYYFLDGDQLIFASEPIAILRRLKQKPEADYQRIYDYLVFNRSDHDSETFFKYIKKLPHGHTMSILEGNVEISRWYDVSKSSADSNLTPEQYYRLLVNSIKVRMRSDVPVGLTLSGGLDSSSIASILVKELNRPDIHTFSAIYGEGYKYDESRFVNCYRNQLPSLEFVHPTVSDLIEDLEKFIEVQQEPVGSTSIYASYRIMKQASGRVKVMLNGQGADESLGGYHDFFGIYFIELLKEFKIIRLIREIAFCVIKFKSFYSLKAAIYYLLPAGLQNRARLREKKYVNEAFSKEYASSSSIPSKILKITSLEEALVAHLNFKLEHLLKWDDRNTMYFGIEGRNPFLDYKLVEASLKCKSERKIDRAYTKVILREGMKGVLPEEIRLRRDKIGFSTPEAEWFRSPLFREIIIGIIKSPSFKSRNIIEPDIALELYSKHCAGLINVSKEIWKWINIELWFRKFIDHEAKKSTL